MADLHSLIKIHKHELDEKRKALAALYDAHDALATQKAQALNRLEAEKSAVSGSEDIHYTFSEFIRDTQNRIRDMDGEMEQLRDKIEGARDELMDCFGELKKYEMTQEERDRLEEEERKYRETLDLDAIGIESWRRQTEEGE